MNKILFLLTLFIVSCNATTNKTTDAESITANVQVTTATEQPGFTVTVTQNNKQVLEYTNDAMASTTVIYNESAKYKGHLAVYLNHSKHSLTVDVQATATGTYPIKLPAGVAEKGTASITLIPDPAEFKYALNAVAGHVNITHLTDAICSGNFEASNKTPDGKSYTLNGTFKNIPVKQIQ